MKRNLALIASLFGGLTLAVNAAVIDFEADAGGGKANGFSPVGHPLVTFTDTVGTGLSMYSGVEALGQSLLVFTDSDASKLRINFGAPMGFLSLMFGNDDAGFTIASDRAWLELFNGGTSVGLFSMAMNRNDLMDQTIIGSAASFDRAEFWYGNAAGAPTTGGQGAATGLTEVVDQIDYRAATGTVPDAGSTLGLSMIALLGLVAARRKILS